MAVPKVDLKMGTAIVQVYDGSQAGLSSFIDSVMLFADTVDADFAAASAAQKAAATATVIRFIKTRLTGKARAAVGDNPRDINEIVNKLKERCGMITSPDVYVAKLHETKQTGDINKFTNDVENLVFLLEKAYISENIPVETAYKMATKQGVKALCTGVRNTETKLLLKSGQFEKLSDAIEKAVENESTTSSGNQNTQIMYAARRGHAYRGRGNSYNNRGNRNQDYYANRGGFSNHRGRGNFQRRPQSNYYDNRSNFNYQRGRGQQRGGYRGNMQPRIFYANAESGQHVYASQVQNVPNVNQQPPQHQPQPQQQHQQNFLGQLRNYVQ